jgi:hypothetical protein
MASKKKASKKTTRRRKSKNLSMLKYRGYDFVKRNNFGEVDILRNTFYQATGRDVGEAVRIVDAMEGD